MVLGSRTPRQEFLDVPGHLRAHSGEVTYFKPDAGSA